MPECSCFRTPFGSQGVHGSQRQLKSVCQDDYPNFSLIIEKLSYKTSLFVRCEILRMFGTTLPADHIDSRDNIGKFPQHVKTALSQKRKIFFPIFIAFLQSTQNFANFFKKVQLYSLNSCEVIDSEKSGCLNVWKLLFQNILRQSKCSREGNTAEICLGGPLS